MTNNNSAPSYAAILEADQTLEGQAIRTPLIESFALNEKLGSRLFLKCEMLQHTGSFKFRGAYNAISKLNSEQRKNGVFAYSSGNHAQGIALAAKLLGTHATILMPEDTPAIKVSNTKGYGGTVVTYNRYAESREEIGAKIASDQNLTLIKPYDNVDVISGQGTVGLEVARQLEDLNTTADIIVAPCGGGGLLSGISLAMSSLSPNTAIFSAEPENFDDTARSLALKSRVANSGDHRSICDAIVTPMPGEITFPIMSSFVSSGLVVTDEEVKDAMRTAFQYFKVVIEPGGAVALAALLTGKVDIKNKTA
ncbi:MAG: threonine/serine dehydratase, partial [Sneathiella sp.]